MKPAILAHEKEMLLDSLGQFHRRIEDGKTQEDFERIFSDLEQFRRDVFDLSWRVGK